MLNPLCYEAKDIVGTFQFSFPHISVTEFFVYSAVVS